MVMGKTGCYDTVVFECPKCGEDIVAQSESGSGTSAKYYIDAVPIDVAQDINRHAPFQCKKCLNSCMLGGIPSQTTVKVSLVVLEL